MRVSNSKIKTFQRCEKQYEYKYVEKLEPKAKALPLERGSWIHKLLEVHYNGGSWKDEHKKLTKVFLNETLEEEREEFGDLPSECARIMRSYAANYKREDEGLRVIDSELDEVLILPNGLEFNFIIDLIVEEADGGLWLWDHKTRKRFEDLDLMLLEGQLTRYFWAATHMGYTPLRGVILNEIRTKPPTVPELTYNGTQLTRRKNLDSDWYTYYSELRKHGFDPSNYSTELKNLSRRSKDFFRRTRLPKARVTTQRLMDEMVWTASDMIRKERDGHFSRTVINNCKWDCSFRDLCITELHGGDTTQLRKMNFKRRSRRGE